MASWNFADMKPKTYAFVGTGNRVRMFLDPAASTYKKQAKIVAFCDVSQTRMSWHADRLRNKYGVPPPPFYPANQFSKMISDIRPDVVVVTTVDSTHDQYIVESLKANCDVVTEKPMTIDADRCQNILDAVKTSGRKVRVTFNYRWGPGATEVKKLLASGKMGRVRMVNLEYLLNTRHGADYFRRWHSNKECSGGLLVHKSTHHFDLANWWIDSIPQDVFARGALSFYGEANAKARGDIQWVGFPRYTGRDNRQDPFAYPLDDPGLSDPELEQGIYLNAEKETGYLRDQNVFRSGITIEDTMGVLVRYRDGTLLNYSLNAFSPYEGYTVSFTCERGRVEYREFHGSHILGQPEDSPLVNEHGSWKAELHVFPHFQNPYLISIPHAEGGHGGGDPLLQEQIFSLEPPLDPWGRSAGHEQGAASILVGAAANRSMESGSPVQIAQLAHLRPEVQRLSELI